MHNQNQVRQALVPPCLPEAFPRTKKGTLSRYPNVTKTNLGNEALLDFLFAPEVVEFVGLEDRRLTFRCKKSYKVGQTARIKISIPIQDGSHTMQLPVVVRSVRKLEDGTKHFLVASEVPSKANPLESIRDMVDSMAAQSGKGARRRPRYKLSLRTLSKDFPGFKALSVDFNALGIQVQTEGPLEQGKEVSLDMELEKADLPHVICKAVVRWCTQVERKRYLIGLEFIGISEELSAELQEFEKFIVARSQGEVFHRTLGLGQHGEFDLPSSAPVNETRTVSLGLNPPPPLAPPPPPTQP